MVGTTVELPVDDGPRVAMEVLRLLDQHGLVSRPRSGLREPSLDDVFLALTGKRTEADDEDETTSIPTDASAAGAGHRPLPVPVPVEHGRRATMSTTTDRHPLRGRARSGRRPGHAARRWRACGGPSPTP